MSTAVAVAETVSYLAGLLEEKDTSLGNQAAGFFALIGVVLLPLGAVSLSAFAGKSTYEKPGVATAASAAVIACLWLLWIATGRMFSGHDALQDLAVLLVVAALLFAAVAFMGRKTASMFRREEPLGWYVGTLLGLAGVLLVVALRWLHIFLAPAT